MIVGIDIGTQSLKAVIADSTLQVIGEGSVAYQPNYPSPGRAEQDPHLWERALGPAIASALKQANVPAREIKALGVCGQLDGCIAVDERGDPLGPCLIWTDRRAQAEVADVPVELVRSRTGLVCDASHMAAKIRWLLRHDPEAAKAACFHQPVSYVVERLTGVSVIDHALASMSMVYAIEQRRYAPELLERFEIDAKLLPPIREAQAKAGPLSAAGAELTGLPAGIPVAVGTGDDFSNALGAGLIAPGTFEVTLGTGEVLGAIHPQPIIDPGALVETTAYPSGGYFLKNPGWLAGGAVVWLRNVIGFANFENLDAEAALVPPGADGVTFFPALTGALAPEWHAGARGCFYGLTPSHGRGHLARALLEGCAFAMRDVADRLRELGVEINNLLLLGGGARSRIWTQMRTDILGMPGQVAARVDTSPVGAAMLAAVAAEIVPDLTAAAALVSRDPARVLEPDRQTESAYTEAYQRYRRLFECLRPMFKTGGEVT
jgi:xylulokinase